MKPDYCTVESATSCEACSLSSYGRDCHNNPIAYSIGKITGCLGIHERTTRKMLNDAGARLDELKTDPGEMVPRLVVIDLFAMRAGDRIGRKLWGLLIG